MNILFNQQKPKYIQIYEQITQMINQGILKSNEKLPSKRELSQNLGVSLNTILNAYYLLLEEGYIYTIEKKGYYVSAQPIFTQPAQNHFISQEVTRSIQYDFTTQNMEKFQNNIWKKLSKEILDSSAFLNKTSLQGSEELRMAISEHLLKNRGIQVNPEQIIIGCGIEIFERILSVIELPTLTLENPGYHKLAEIAQNLPMEIDYQPLDEQGIILPSRKTILYTTSFNQFPTGIKMSITRKKELVQWARNENTFIIEDDFDAEFRINSAPTTSLYSLEPNHVIFFSTFSTTLFPGLRLSYTILPVPILEKYRKKYQNYSCSVPTFEQMIVKEFINSGAYASHINRKKKEYIKKREDCLDYLKNISFLSCDNKKNYLSLLVQIKEIKDCKDLILYLKTKGIKISSLSTFDKYETPSNILILGYTAISEDKLHSALECLTKEIEVFLKKEKYR